jgi:Flp pilus assembly protein TadD
VTRADFVGSAACGACHDQKLAAWKHDWHARALTPATPAFVAGRFPAAFHGSSSAAEMRIEAGRYLMHTAGADGTAADWPIAWLVGGKRMQDTLTVLADGRWQVLPVYFHVTGKAWVDYTEAKQGALTPEHPFYWTNFRRTANRECLDCHTTGLFVGYDEASGRFSTDFADAGVGCEACHGPGAKHAESQDAADIFRPDHARPEQELAVCGQCHAPRNPLFPLLDAGHRFRPGDRYDELYQALVVVDGSERSGDYFADGRPKTSSFELTALLESRCHRAGGATCLTCHDAPHKPHAGARNELRAADPDASCRGCHQEDAAHSRHRSAQAQRCVSCHMPRLVSGVLDHFADHALDVPAPAVTAKHGVPNACNGCHAHEKVPPAEMDAALLRLWPDAGKRQARRMRLADAIDEATWAGSHDALVAVVGDTSEAPILRGAAAVLLAQRFPDDAGAIAPLLRDADALLRARAAAALGHAHPPREVVDRLGVLAVSDPALAVKQAAITSLALLGEAARADAAARTLAADPEGGALPQVHVVVGVLALRRGDLALATTELGRAIALAPYHADARVWRAQAYARAGKLDDARRELTLALRFAPENAEARRALAALPPIPAASPK